MFFKRPLPGIVLALVLGGLTVACGEDAGPGGVDTSLDTPTTKVRQLGTTQAVFDLMPGEAHDDMLEMMGGPAAIVSGEAGATEAETRYVLLTLMDTGARGATITDANVRFTVNGPDGAPLAEGGHVMSGKGMHHYAVGFAGEATGTYRVTANIERGAESYTPVVEFEVTE